MRWRLREREETRSNIVEKRNRPNADFNQENFLYCQYFAQLFLLFFMKIIYICISYTRSYAALRAADLEWIDGPRYSLGRVHSGVPEGGRAGISKNVTKGGVTTDLGGG